MHATARSRTVAGGSLRKKTDLSAFDLTHRIDARDAYETARRFGLDYADNFKLLAHAELYADRYLEVDLVPPQRPAHPWLSYDLNPVSVDAAFHGLVGFLIGLLVILEARPISPYASDQFAVRRKKKISCARWWKSSVSAQTR